MGVKPVCEREMLLIVVIKQHWSFLILLQFCCTSYKTDSMYQSMSKSLILYMTQHWKRSEWLKEKCKFTFLILAALRRWLKRKVPTFVYAINLFHFSDCKGWVSVTAPAVGLLGIVPTFSLWLSYYYYHKLEPCFHSKHALVSLVCVSVFHSITTKGMWMSPAKTNTESDTSKSAPFRFPDSGLCVK